MTERKKKLEAGGGESEAGSVKEVKAERLKAKGVKKAEISSPTLEEENNPALKETRTIDNSQPTTNPSQPATESMEVHHHPEVEKKGFKEYLLEGLMIFLAVTMGFFAERLRETINEHNRAKEFAITLYSDLKADTADLNGYITYHKNAGAHVDTLMQLLSAGEPKQVPPGKLYWFGLWGGAYRLFIPHDATLLEMKSSGSLRYFTNVSINRQLAQYDQLCQSMKIVESNDQGIYTEVRKARAQLFNFKYNAVVNDISHIKNMAIRQAKVDSFIKSNPPLFSYDKLLFNEYVEMVRSRFFERKVLQADTLLNHATGLIGALKKEYVLDGE
ncbi:MAG: hypothetical protein JWP37_2196 [Mucilaginibacter sp.]|nr:hypothetical protein [Mucilaginibacter sp.]